MVNRRKCDQIAYFILTFNFILALADIIHGVHSFINGENLSNLDIVFSGGSDSDFGVVVVVVVDSDSESVSGAT